MEKAKHDPLVFSCRDKCSIWLWKLLCMQTLYPFFQKLCCCTCGEKPNRGSRYSPWCLNRHQRLYNIYEKAVEKLSSNLDIVDLIQ